MRASFRPLLIAVVAATAFGCSMFHRTPVTGVDTAALDTKISPCSDFYQFSCGNWIAHNPIPADETSWGTFQALAERNLDDLRKILDAAMAPAPKKDEVTREVGDYYAACMDLDQVNRLGWGPIQQELDNVNSLRSKDELAGEIARLQVAGAEPMFSFGSDQDYKDANQEIAEADQGGLGLPDRDYYTKTDAKSVELRAQYQAHVEKMMELLGDKPPQAAAEAKSVMAIETALAKASMTNVARRDPAAVYHKMSRAQFEGLTPDFQWDEFFTGAGVPTFDALNVAVPGFFQALAAQINAVPLADWKAYLRWHLAHAAATALSQPFVDANFEFYGLDLTGQKEETPRWKRCVTSTDGHLGEALGQLYVRQYFGPEAKQKTEAMVEQLETALGQDINSLTWMTAATKQQAMVKLQAIVNKIGYPAHWRDYGSIQLTRDNFYTDVRRSNAFEWHRQLNKIGKPVDRTEFGMTPPTVNAYYNPEWNEIVFPAGILQPPFYNANRDVAVNFGGIGAVIGHELTHGFDDEGRQFDARGNMRDWWTKADADAFQQRAACLIKEYGGFSPLEGVKLNGELTLGENTADNGGVRIAYMALQSALAGQPDKSIDGYNTNQRFFIGFAQDFCENTRPEMARMLANVDPHSPGQFRVNGVVTNMPEFAQAFHCGPNDPMTAKATACRVW